MKAKLILALLLSILGTSKVISQKVGIDLGFNLNTYILFSSEGAVAGRFALPEFSLYYAPNEHVKIYGAWAWNGLKDVLDPRSSAISPTFITESETAFLAGTSFSLYKNNGLIDEDSNFSLFATSVSFGLGWANAVNSDKNFYQGFTIFLGLRITGGISGG